MGKPKVKREVTVLGHLNIGRVRNISLDIATNDAVDDIKKYGSLEDDGLGGYRLWVHGRYDFNDVLEYCRNYGRGAS